LIDKTWFIPILGIGIFCNFVLMIDPYKAKALNRLKKLRGQLDGVINMIEDDKYCIDIVTQMLAVQGSLKGVLSLLLESHLHSCSAEHLVSKDAAKKQKFIEELVNAFTLTNR